MSHVIPFSFLGLRVPHEFIEFGAHQFSHRRVGIQTSYPKVESRVQGQAIEKSAQAFGGPVVHDCIQYLEWIGRAIVRTTNPVQIVGFLRARLMAAQDRMNE